MQRTEGARLLGRISATQVQIAARCGVSQGLVSLWRSGAKRPGPEKRELLQAAYGISMDDWNKAPLAAQPIAA